MSRKELIRAAATSLFTELRPYSKKKALKRPFTTRLTPEARHDLDEVAKATKMSRSEILERGIQREHQLHQLSK